MVGVGLRGRTSAPKLTLTRNCAHAYKTRPGDVTHLLATYNFVGTLFDGLRVCFMRYEGVQFLL